MKALLFLLLILPWGTALAEFRCNMDLNYGLVVNDRQLRVIDRSGTQYQINNKSQLLVRGEWIQLNADQQARVNEFAEGIHYVVPKMILLANEGVALAIGTIEHVYVGLVGKEHASYDNLKKALKKVKVRIKEKFVRAGDNYYMGPGSLEQVDDLVDKEIEAQIEKAINTSLGGVLSAIGGLRSGGEEEMEAKMESLSKRLEAMGVEIDRQVGPQADDLRQKAQWFCQKLQSLDGVEDAMRGAIKELKPYEVIVAGENGYSERR